MKVSSLVAKVAWASMMVSQDEKNDGEEEEDGIRIFSWTARGARVVGVETRDPTRGRANWRLGDSDEEEEELMRRAVDMAVDAETIKSQAPMLQAGLRRFIFHTVVYSCSKHSRASYSVAACCISKVFFRVHKRLTS